MKFKTKRRLVIQYFLRKFHKLMDPQKEAYIDPVFLNIYTKDDLLDIVTWLYTPTVNEWLKFEKMSNEELLEVIGVNHHILRYELNRAEEELSEQTRITPKRVFNTLQQLGLETHYLMEKPIGSWDDYDYSNYRALSYKAGNPVPVFGIFDSTVNEEDKYFVTTPPGKLFDTKEAAETALDNLVGTGQLQPGDAKIMML